jgi:hypothetical protein
MKKTLKECLNESAQHYDCPSWSYAKRHNVNDKDKIEREGYFDFFSQDANKVGYVINYNDFMKGWMAARGKRV